MIEKLYRNKKVCWWSMLMKTFLFVGKNTNEPSHRCSPTYFSPTSPHSGTWMIEEVAHKHTSFRQHTFLTRLRSALYIKVWLAEACWKTIPRDIIKMIRHGYDCGVDKKRKILLYFEKWFLNSRRFFVSFPWNV